MDKRLIIRVNRHLTDTLTTPTHTQTDTELTHDQPEPILTWVLRR